MKICKECIHHDLETKTVQCYDMEGYPQIGEYSTEVTHLCNSKLSPITGEIERVKCISLNKNGDCEYYEKR